MSQLLTLSHYHHCHNYHYCQNYLNFLNYHCHNYSNFNIYSIYLKLIQNDKLEMNIPWCCSSLNQLPPKNNRIRGGRRKKLKSSWEIKRNYANWNYLREIMQIDENFLFDFNSAPRHPFADVAERSGDNFQLFLKKMFLCFAREWNCQSEKFLVSSERFDNSWTPTWSKSIWSIVFFSMGWICCEVKIYSIFMLFVLYWPSILTLANHVKLLSHS